MEISHLVKAFEQLSLSDKKGKLKNMIEYAKLQRVDIVFVYLYDNMETNNKIDDQFCIGVYKDILWLAKDLKDLSIKDHEQKIVNIKKKIKALEANSREEEHADDLLNSL